MAKRGVAQAQAAGAGEGRAVAGQAGRQHAVEHVDAGRHRLHQADRVADAHQVAGPVGGQLGEGGGEGRQHLGRDSPTDRPPMP